VAGESGSFWQLERVNRRRTRALVMKLVLVLAAFGLGLDFLFTQCPSATDGFWASRGPRQAP
jgi:hypothetical protein